MSKILFVTTMNDRLYDEYGYLFLSEYEKYADNNLLLINYVDNDTKKIFDNNFKKINISFLHHKLHEQFIEYYENVPSANGYNIYLDEDSRKINVDFSYRFNAVRYSYKVFAMHKAFQLAKIQDYDFLIWMDSDMRCIRNFSSSDLLEFLPNSNEIMSYLGRTHFPVPPHSETGFLCFNLLNEQCENFINAVIQTYLSGKIFTYEQFHDCWVFDRNREQFENNGFKFKNLSGLFADQEHPFVHTNLGLFFDHLKGRRKKDKRSVEHPLNKNN